MGDSSKEREKDRQIQDKYYFLKLKEAVPDFGKNLNRISVNHGIVQNSLLRRWRRVEQLTKGIV